MAAFFDFLQESRIGSVGLGSPCADFLQTFGKPTYWEGFNQIGYDSSEIWTYGNLQININKQREISTFQFIFEQGISNDFGLINFVDLIPTSDFTEAKFIKFLNQLGISYRTGFLQNVPKRFVQVLDGPHAAFSPHYIEIGDDLVQTEESFLFKIRIDLEDNFWGFDYDAPVANDKPDK